MSEERVGVYVCHCGTNIAGIVDVEEVAQWAAGRLKDRGVVIARDYKFMCSSLGQEMIEKDIHELGLTRVVVAACSPHLHEQTFRTACKRAGLNPYLCELVSIREQVSWVHTEQDCGDRQSQGRRLGWRGARSAASAARTAARADSSRHPGRRRRHRRHPGRVRNCRCGFPVYLVEREPSIGGHMAQFDKTFPTLDCAACILTPKMVSVGTHPNVTMLTWSEVERVDGYVGNFTVTIRKKARYVNTELCTGCGICQEKCPKKVIDDIFEAGSGLSQSGVYALPAGRAEVSGDRSRQLHLLPERHVQRLREVLPDRRDRFQPTGRDRSPCRWATSFWRPATICSILAESRTTVMADWRTSSPAWSSSGCRMPPARPMARSCCAMG